MLLLKDSNNILLLLDSFALYISHAVHLNYLNIFYIVFENDYIKNKKIIKIYNFFFFWMKSTFVGLHV
jgi:hypothetical protein